MRSSFAPLRIPAFRRLFAAYALNGLGDWFGEIALAVLVLQQTGSPLAVALVLVFGRLLPGFITPLLVARMESAGSGAVAGLFAGEAVVFALFAVFAAGMWLPLLFALAAIDGVFALAARALTRAANARVLEGAGFLREGNALMNFAFTTHCAFGAALAGVVVAFAGAQVALAIDALSFAVCAALLAWRCELPALAVSADTVLERLRAGLQHVRDDRVLGRLLLGEGIASLLFALIIPVEIVFVTSTLGGTAADYGLVLTAWGVGMIVGAALVPKLQRCTLQVLTLVSLVVMAVSYVGMGASTAIPVAAAWSLAGGVGNGVEGFAVLTLVQERTAPALQARVSGLLESLHTIAPGAGFLIGGVLASAVSPRAAYLVAGSGALLVVMGLGCALSVPSITCTRLLTGIRSTDFHAIGPVRMISVVRMRVGSVGPALIATLCVAAMLLAAGASASRYHDDCEPQRAGEQCGPGNGRHTPGGGEKVSHKDWPSVTGILWKVLDSRDHHKVGGDDNDELLGHHGDDQLAGGDGKDILWGDWDPSNNNTRQRDVLRGGEGNDWLYSSHGNNTILGGPGRDYIWAYYGRGTIDCGPGLHDTARVRLDNDYRIENCERIKNFCGFGSKPGGGCYKPGEKPAARRLR